MSKKVRVATTWLDACSGCHMSFLDLDEAWIELADRIELVYSPLVDAKEIPDDIDVFLITGSVSTDEDVKKVRTIRKKSRVVVALGDCAVTGNVPSMRNPLKLSEVLDHAYQTTATHQPQVPGENLPELLPRVLPVHAVIPVDEFIQGCPPRADLIGFVVQELLAGRIPGRGIRTTFG